MTAVSALLRPMIRVVVVVFLVAAGLYVLAQWHPAAPAPASSARSAESPSQVLGQERHLSNPSEAVVLLALNQDDLHQIVLAAAMNDSVGLRRLAATPRFFQVETGTSVRVIDTATLPEGPLIRQVRILSGKRIGDAGWVMAEALAP